MINFIEKLSKDAKAHLYLLESFSTPPKGYLDSIAKRTQRMSALGEAYVYSKTLESLEKHTNRIKTLALSEINGTYYNDHLKQYEGTDMESEYTRDTVYEDILSYNSWKPGLEISNDIQIAIEMAEELSGTMSKGFNKHFPTVPVYKEENGELRKTNLSEIQMYDALESGATKVNIGIFNARGKRIFEIAENKGNLGEIIKLIG